MAYDDKDDTKFPTRFGQATGHANERTMLDELGGANGIRHRQRLGADGVTTHVKTRGGHPHFWNEPLPGSYEEPVSPIYMDSGAVDLLSVTPTNPLSALAAPLYYSNDQRAAYTAGKLLGKITPPDITNPEPPVDTEPGESFIPVTGGDLLGKKDCAAKCPPSMFTGKARLYAQAQLGAPLKKWGWTLDLPEAQPPRWVHDSTGFVLDINVGIYTDGDNKHWLLSMSGSGVMVTPLKPSKSAKLLVPNLSDPEYAADKTKIEAYILAHSAPGGASESFFVTVSGLPPPYMLGYGWKFNWGGNKADIIKHVEGSPQHSSTHYRLSINRNVGAGFASEINRWTFELSVVEGPVYWHNYKYDDVICAPDWITNTLYKFGTVFGGHIGNAPLYCFYKEGGGLEVIRYSGSGGEANIMRSSISEPPCWTWVFDWTSDSAAASFQYENGTYGLEGASGERRLRTNNPTITGFSSQTGPNSVRPTQSYTYSRYVISGKTPHGNNAGNIGGNMAYDAYEEEGVCINTGYSVTYTTNDGVPVYTSGVSTYTNTGAYVDRAIGNYVPYIYGADVSREEWSGSKVESKSGLMVVPFHDAEAVYMYANLNTRETAEGHGGAITGYQHNGGAFQSVVYNFFVIEGTNPTEYWNFPNYYLHGGGATHQPGTPSSGLPPKVENKDDIFVSSVITRSGVFDFTSPISLSPFFATVDFVEQTFYTHSAIHGPMYGFGAKNADGITHPFDSPPPFIGWA